MPEKPETFNEYLDSVDEDKQKALQELNAAIQKIIPDAVEGFSYGLPAYRLNGRPVVAFGAAKKHCSLYPLDPEIIDQFRDDLKDFEISKGTIRFQPGHPIPGKLLRKLIEARIKRLAGA